MHVQVSRKRQLRKNCQNDDKDDESFIGAMFTIANAAISRSTDSSSSMLISSFSLRLRQRGWPFEIETRWLRFRNRGLQ